MSDSEETKSLSELTVKDLEGFEVDDGTNCSDKMVYAGGSFFAAGLAAGALQGGYPQLWPNVKIRGPGLNMTLYIMSRHSVTWGLAASAFALGACLTARHRNKEGITSCIVGGVMSGMVFAVRYRATHSMPWTTAGISLLVAVVTSAYKLAHGTYLPAKQQDERREYLLLKRREARGEEMVQITARRILDHEEWKSRQ